MSADSPTTSLPERIDPARRNGQPSTRRMLLSLAVAAMGVIDVLSALLSHPPERLMALLPLVPTEVLDTSRTFTLLAGALLLVTAWGLRRGKRRAYVTALFLCALSVPVNVLKALDIEEAVVAAGLMFLLGISADAFRVESRSLSLRSLRSGVLWFAVALAVYVGAGEIVLERNYGVGTSWQRAFQDAGYHLLGIGDPVAIVTQPMPPARARVVTWYHRSLPLLALAFVLFASIASLRPARHRRRHRTEVARVRELLLRHGDSSIAAFALEDDVDYFFSANARAVIPYRFEADTLLAIGDPVGPVEEMGPLLREFERHCLERDWQFAFFQARAERLALYRELGWRALHIGEDPVLWTESFTLAGGGATMARRAVRKAEGAGLEVRAFVPDASPFGLGAGGELLDELRDISHAWVQAHPGGEKNFCMGRFDPHRLAESWLLVAWNPSARRVEGFMTWVPIWARRGWALDLMRRRSDSAPGTMELLVVTSVQAARERGDAMLSLSLSALAKVGPDARAARDTDADSDRARAFLSQHLARFYDFQGLFQWKKKFDPAFEDRYLVYPRASALPQVAFALVRAQSPGGLRGYWRQLFPPARPVEGTATGNGTAESAA